MRELKQNIIMEKKDIKKVIEKVTDVKIRHIHPYSKSELEDSLTEALHQALIKSGVRTSCLKECWEMWLQSKHKTDVIRWLLGQLA